MSKDQKGQEKEGVIPQEHISSSFKKQQKTKEINWEIVLIIFSGKPFYKSNNKFQFKSVLDKDKRGLSLLSKFSWILIVKNKFFTNSFFEKD